MRKLILALTAIAAIGGVGTVHADSAKPDDPNGYAEVVSFGAQEDHDLYPGPGNVVGDVRSDVASSGEGHGVSEFVDQVKGFTGSLPNPPGRD